MQKQMKILSITAQKPHSTGSGVYLTELVRNWQEIGCVQAVVAGIYEEDYADFPEEVTFYPVKFHTEKLPFSITGMSDEMPYESTRYRDMTPEMVKKFHDRFRYIIEKAVRELDPDLIVCHHLYLLTAMVREWYPNKRIIAFSHGSDLRQIRKNPLEREYIQKQIAKLDLIIALQNAHKEEIKEIFGVEDNKVYVAGAGYNDKKFFRKERIKKPYYQIAFAGKVSEKKGVFSLLRAVNQLAFAPDELKVKLAGGHGVKEEYEEIQKLAEESKYEVEFLGMLKQRELADVLRESDVFVLPSYFEGLGLVLIEAMACGCKVVCSEIPGVTEWFRENVPGCRISFVKLPTMVNTDEPVVEELPEFEERLASAIRAKLMQKEEEYPQLEQISWKGISGKILQIAAGLKV